MGNKEIKIIPPNGYIIDQENSTFECIKFKPKSLTYEDIVKGIFIDGYYYIDDHATIYNCFDSTDYYKANSATSKKQCEKLLAINKLMNVAKYLNGNWKPDWNTCNECKFYIYIVKGCIKIDTLCISPNNTICNHSIVYFKSEELAQQAIDILGEDTIRLALSTDW